MCIATRVATSLDNSEYPGVMLDGAANSQGRGGIHAVHPTFIKLVRIPQLIAMGTVALVLQTQNPVVFLTCLAMISTHVLRTTPKLLPQAPQCW